MNLLNMTNKVQIQEILRRLNKGMVHHRPVFFWPSRHNFLYIKAEISHPYLTTKFENSSLKNI